VGLKDHFEDVQVLVPDFPVAERETTFEGLRVRRVVYFRPRSWQRLCYDQGILDNLRRRPLAAIQVVPYVLAMAGEIVRTCRADGVRIVNSHWLVPQGLAGAVARGGTDFRHVVHVHGAGLQALRRLPSGVGKRLVRFIVARTDRFVCASAHVREQLDRFLGVKTNAAVSPMGVDLQKFRKESESVHVGQSAEILFVGRLVEKKGVEHLIRALPLVLKGVPSAMLTVVGSGALSERLQSLAGQLGIAASVRFVGAMPHGDVIGRIRSADVVVVPSVVDSRGEADGMPTVLLEAMAASKRVVASRVDGIPEVLRAGENGWLCRPGDPHHLAETIILALGANASSVIDAARRTAEQYGWPLVCKRYAGFLR